MRIDHRGADVVVAQQFLDGADVASVFEQMGREAVWFWVDAATRPSTANELRNYTTSGAPISAGSRLPWNTMKRRLHAI